MRKTRHDSIRSHQAGDRRRYQRLDSLDLDVVIHGRRHPVADFSVSGIRILGLSLTAGQSLLMTIRDAGSDASPGIDVKGEVVGCDDLGCRVRFAALSYGLARMLIHSMARQTGAQPYLFR